MQLRISFAKSMAFQKIMNIQNCAVRSFASHYVLVIKKVYLARYRLTANTEKCTYKLVLAGWDLKGNGVVACNHRSDAQCH